MADATRVTLPANGAWTAVATNTTQARIERPLGQSVAQKNTWVLITHVDTGNPAPVDDDDALPMPQDGEYIILSAAADFYARAVGVESDVLVRV